MSGAGKRGSGAAPGLSQLARNGPPPSAHSPRGTCILAAALKLFRETLLTMSFSRLETPPRIAEAGSKLVLASEAAKRNFFQNAVDANEHQSSVSLPLITAARQKRSSFARTSNPAGSKSANAESPSGEASSLIVWFRVVRRRIMRGGPNSKRSIQQKLNCALHVSFLI